MSVSVSKYAQKNLGETTHPIGRTRLMHMTRPLSPGADGMTYTNAPTYDGLTVPRWFVSVNSNLDTWTGL